ncbi:MAG: thermonuclease family protein [Polaromonas sp.]
MRNIVIGALVSALLIGCGGGGGASVGEGDGNPDTTQSVSASPTQTGMLCGVEVGAKLLEGSVTDVHDGDTITLSVVGTPYKIRLDSIDAPELAQPFGSLSQSTLASAVLGKPVKVAYTKTDQYDRIVGAVFTDSCQYVNLNQVAAGMAWFYKAYQCEVSAAVRSQFAQAQDNAVAAKTRLWAQSDPEAPWFYRNGVEPVTPTCTSHTPIVSGNAALSSVGPSTAANSSSPITVSTSTASSSKVCYTGPRGGTYTLTENGNKNYSGC